MNGLSWSLEYADGDLRSEAPGDESIRSAPKGATKLLIVALGHVIITDVPLSADERPVFYRVPGRKLDDDFVIAPATVFGKGRAHGSEIYSQLWAGIDRHVIDCPTEYIDAGLIELQVCH